MGSLSATGIPVAAKTSDTFRKRDILITRSVSTNDTVESLVTTPVSRAITSGTIVRDDGSVDYYEDLVWGLYNESRSSSSRVPSKASNPRDLRVAITGSGTLAVIEDSLAPNIPQISMRHTGDKVVKGQAVTDVQTRIADSGVFDLGFPL